MELKIRTGFMKGIVNFFIERYLKKQFGVKANFKLNELSVSTDENGVSHVNVSFNADMKETELNKVVSRIKED